MKLIKPVAITDTNMATNVPESEPQYNPATTYANLAIVRGNTTDTQHMLFRSLQAGNMGHLPDGTQDTLWWQRFGATNRWKALDGAVNSQTKNPGVASYSVVATEGVIDSTAALNIVGERVTVVVKDSANVVQETRTIELVSTDGINDWYPYFYVAPLRATDVYIQDLPAILNATVTFTIEDDLGNEVAIGLLNMGQTIEIGRTQYGARIGITDYSVKQVDDFGNYTILKRAFSRRGSYVVEVAAERVDYIVNLMAELRSTPIIYIGTEFYASSFTYGYYKEFEVEIAYKRYSWVSLEIEGLI